MKRVSLIFQNFHTMLSAVMHLQYIGLYHGIVCQRKFGYAMKLKHSGKSERLKFIKFVNKSSPVI